MGWFDNFLSVITGGVSDLTKGKPVGSGTADLINGVFPEGTFAGQVMPSLLNPVGAANRDIGRTIDKGGKGIDVLSTLFDRLADPTNSVNYSLGEMGEQLPEEVRKIAPSLGALIGTIAYPVAGTAIGTGVGSHLAGANSTQALTGAGLAATSAYAGGQLAEALNASPVPSGGAETLRQATDAVTSSGGAPDAIPIIKDMIDTTNYNQSILAGQMTGAGTSSDPGISPQGEVNIPPTGSLDTLESLIENTVESPATNLPSGLSVDPIPNTGAPMEAVAPTGTPSPDFSGMSMPDTTPGVSTMDLKQAAGDVYKAANTGLRVKNVLDLLQNISKAKNNPSIAAMQNANAMPVGTINATLGNMAGNEKNKAWGAVLV